MLSGLYLITDDNQDNQLLQRVERALRGGVSTLQYRDKQATPQERLQLGRQLREICLKHKVRFIVNDHAELARELDADGLHLGQEDISVAEARQIIGRDKLIGISTHSVEQALKAENHGADYIAIGSIFPTASKEAPQVIGVDILSRIRRAVRIPLVAIGGITLENAAEVIDAGADSLAVISSVMHSDDPAIAARELALLFNRNQQRPRGRVLTIAGSDCSGGAGIQADLKTISLLGSYGSSVITALTAQNSLGVREVLPIDSDFVAEQLDAVLDDIGSDTVKTGMLNWGGTINRTAKILAQHSMLTVVDPVMAASDGTCLLAEAAIDSLLSQLLPQTYLLTPNLHEASALAGIAVDSIESMEEAARILQQLGARHVLIKGGHLDGREALDLLLYGDEVHRFSAPRHATRHTHGTGCTYSAAIATFLAQGQPLLAAVTEAKKFISLAIQSARPCGSGNGPVNHIEAAFGYFHHQS